MRIPAAHRLVQGAGAFNNLLAAQERAELDPDAGVVVASGGNAGLAHAFAAAELGFPATVFVPETAPAVKVERLRRVGAEVRQVGEEYAEARAAADEFAARTGALLGHAYDQVPVAAGAGTVAEEILRDEPSIGTIVVAVGGGGLLAGVLAAAEGRARVVGAEPRTASTLRTALDRGGPVDVDVAGVAADALGARRIGEICFDTASRVGVTSVLVEDDDVVEARAQLWRDYRIATEHGAAVAHAALRSGAHVPDPDERVAVVLCGANTDPSTLT